MTHPDHCLNCDTALKPADNFCANCGQLTNTHPRITMHHINHEVVHAFTHADKGLFYLIKELFTRPGNAIKEYLAGRHKKYFSPFTFFFLVLGIYVLSNSFFKPFDKSFSISKGKPATEKVYPKWATTEKGRKKWDGIQERQIKMAHFMNTKTNIVLCISTPFIALMMFLMFRRRLFYAEQLVVMTFVNSVLNLFSIFLFTPLTSLLPARWEQLLVMVMILTHVVYMSIVYHKVLNLPATARGYFKCVGGVIIAIVSWVAFWFMVIALYIFLGFF